jgi:HSP20 family protein
MATLVRRRENSPQGLQRREPFSELEDLQERIGRLMDSVWSPNGLDQIWSPPVAVEETDDAWIVEAEVPGAKRKDINVELRDSELAISGEIKEKEREGILRRSTRKTGEFDYRITLPGRPDPDAVEAKLDGGVLTVRVPKPDGARSRQIEVQSS